MKTKRCSIEKADNGYIVSKEWYRGVWEDGGKEVAGSFDHLVSVLKVYFEKELEAKA